MKNLIKSLIAFACLIIPNAHAQSINSGTAPTGVFARYAGPIVVSGTTTYYWVQAIYPNGRSAFSNYVSVNLPASLGPSNISFVQVGWSVMPGAIAYDVLKTTSSTTPSGACNCAIAVNQTYNGLTDAGLPFLNYTVISGGLYQYSPIATAGDTATLTMSQISNTVLNGTPTAAANYTLPTAASIVAALPYCIVGQSFDTWIRNTSAGANTITVVGSTGSTATGTLTVAQNQARLFVTIVTSCTSPATTTYSMVTGAF
jgi:hypothetical protein